jgi:hypothetical protein
MENRPVRPAAPCGSKKAGDPPLAGRRLGLAAVWRSIVTSPEVVIGPSRQSLKNRFRGDVHIHG